MSKDAEKVVKRLNINGSKHDVLVESSNTLLEVLRYALDFIGTKQGCDKGDCGACTVLQNGKPILSCLRLAQNFDDDDEITTIEGLNAGNKVDLLVEAFLKAGALQCGFCQPGMILSAKALLACNIKPTLCEIKNALSGNLCRCTGYTKIYLAILSASIVMTKEVSDLDQALLKIRESRAHLGDK